MTAKRFTAFTAAVAILFCTGCNYNRIIIGNQPSDSALAVATAADATVTDATATDATATDATGTDAATVLSLTNQTPPMTYDFSQLKYSVNSTAVSCFDVRENRFLYQKHTLTRISPASLTKIVTASVALKFVDPATVFTVGEEVKLAQSNSSLCFILPGHQVTLYDLLCGMLLASGNDAAYTIAVNVARIVSGSALDTASAVAYFVGLMNRYAEEIELTGSHFVNPEGWDDPEQYMTLKDIIVAALFAMQYGPFREIVGKSSYAATFVSGQTITWKNSNQMMDPSTSFFLEGIRGIKTGTTALAKKCLIAFYEDGNRELIIASMGNTTDEERYFSIREIIDTIKYQSGE